jgi:hypothetical protein
VQAEEVAARAKQPRWIVAVGILFSVTVLAGVVVMLFVGGSSQQSAPLVELVGTGQSVKFSVSAISVHDLNGTCSGTHGWLYWLNETGSTQKVTSNDGGLGLILPPTEPGLVGSCQDPPGTYIYGLKSNPSARLVVTATQN